ncbi:MAG TPA: IPT/TIG domain-containing protein [Acidimicrobiales bacterium]|nr:IPT/TIG domain-containing protein [Acidimicrobiales bacterium]
MTPDEPADLGRLLADADRPRPLPPALRHRLEEALGGATAPTWAPTWPPRPLDQALTARLSEVLTGGDVAADDDAMPGLLAGIDSPRPLPGDVSGRLAAALAGARPDSVASARPRRSSFAGSPLSRAVGVAAAVVMLAGAIGVVVSRSPDTRPGVTATGAGPGPRITTPPPAGSAAAGGGPATPPAGSAGTAPPPAPLSQPTAGSAATAPAPPPAASSSPGGAPSGGGAGSGTSSAAAAPAPAPPSPTVRSVSPRTGPASGGTWVTILGSGFSGAEGVRFGQAAATRFTVDSDGRIRALTPVHLPGSVDVVVDTPRGASPPSSGDSFTFTA